MKHEINIHNGYVEWEEATQEGIDFQCLFGKYHHLFSSDEGTISMIRIKDFNDNWRWEIFCIEGQLFEYTEQFDMKKEAMQRIRELLERKATYQNSALPEDEMIKKEFGGSK